MQKNITIPCRPYIASYLLCKYGTEENGNRITLPRNSILFYFLKVLIRKKVNRTRNESRVKMNNYTSSILFELSSPSSARFGGRIFKTSILDFNNFMRNAIFEDFRNGYINFDKPNKITQEKSAENFLIRNKIRYGELNTDTLIRDLKRQNKKNK